MCTMAITPPRPVLILLHLLTASLVPVAAWSQANVPLPSPLALGDAIQIAGDRRDEIQAARARTRAGEARPAIVSALADPMISPSLDHLPFMLGGADVSVTVEQQIPLSGLRGHRRASALADVDRLRAETHRTTLDVGVEAASAFLMLQERRLTGAAEAATGRRSHRRIVAPRGPARTSCYPAANATRDESPREPGRRGCSGRCAGPGDDLRVAVRSLRRSGRRCGCHHAHDRCARRSSRAVSRIRVGSRVRVRLHGTPP